MSKTKSPHVNLNLNVRGLPLSATLRINELSNRLIAEGRQVYKFGLGQSPFPVPAVVEQELRSHAWQKDYLPVMGLGELRSAVSEYLSRTQGVSFSPDSIMIGPGSKELMFILQLVYYGDLVIPTPSWVSYAPQAHIIGRHIHWLPTEARNQWKVTPEALEALCHADPERPRLLILNYPANPHGYSYNERELKAIARVARRYRIVLLSDEIYGEIDFHGRHVSIARFYPEGTIISGGLSKWCGAGGWRLGVFAFPNGMEWLRDAMATVASETYTSTSAPIQHAAIRAFRGGNDIEHYLAQSRRILAALAEQVVAILAEAGVRLPMPDGGFYVFPDFAPLAETMAARGIRGSTALCERVLEEAGVAFLPGSAFGRPDAELTARLAFVDFDGARVLSAADAVPADQPLDREFMSSYCPKVITGMERLRDWLA